MTATQAQCGSISASTLGLPDATAVPQQKGTLPTAMFYARTPVSSKLKQRFVNDIEAITMLAMLRPTNTGIAGTPKLEEILVMGVRHSSAAAPIEVLDHIAGLRRSGIVFVCVRDRPSGEPSSQQASGHTEHGREPQRQEAALAMRRLMPGKPGHPQQTAVLVGPWRPADAMRLELHGADFGALWDSLCSQAVLDSTDGADFDGRWAARAHIETLRAQEAKLTKDHARAKQPAQRNEIYAKLHKIRTELGRLDQR